MSEKLTEEMKEKISEEMTDYVRSIYEAMVRRSNGDKSMAMTLAHLNLIASIELLTACEGEIPVAELCYQIADSLACAVKQ